MTVRKINLFSLCAFALAPLVALWISIDRHKTDWEFLFLLFFFMMIAWGIGIFLGLCLSVLVKKPSTEPYLYLTGHLVVILAIVGFFFIGKSDGRQHERNLANVEDNLFLVNQAKDSYPGISPDYVKTAFLKLQSRFDDPNSFLLEKFSTRWKDTVIHSMPDTVYFVYFMYRKQDKPLFTRITVLGDSAVIDYMDSEKKPDQDTLSTKAGIWGHRGNLDDVKLTPSSNSRFADSVQSEK